MKAFMILVFFASITTFAQSTICPEKGIELEKDVYCCLEKNTCQELYNRYITALKLVKQKETNCHWAAKSLIDGTAARYVSPQEMKQYLSASSEINREDLKLHDLVILHEVNPQVFLMDEDENGRPKGKKWFTLPSGQTIHSAIFLKDNIVFQKESAYNSKYSISTIKQMKEAYQNLNYKKYFERGDSKLKYYSK